VLNDGNYAEVIELYLMKLREKDPSFTFRIARADDGSVNSYLWQTAQRKLTGKLLETRSFDAMKRQINSVQWPYFGPCVLDAFMKVAVVAECIFCQESLVAYAWYVFHFISLSLAAN
jgi:hypothetical protein